MALTPGSRLGPYEILAALGAGGMGEVYRARDPRLARDVALKVLPEGVAADPERLARFEREAKSVAALTHPHIVTIHSIEEAGSVRFLTMELVEGQTLDQVVTPGGLPLRRVLELSVALAEALAAAHEKGIVHRDLKPGNVMVTRDGRVKVLDFGLAKLEERSSAGASLQATQALTVDSPISAAGQVVGTVTYMAPEQIRGEAVDARADLFAFGIMLYLLATGRRPFSGKTAADVSSSILRDAPPPVRVVRSDLPGELDRIVGRCLEKERERRYAKADDLRADLEALREHQSGTDFARRGAAEAPSIAVLPFTNLSADKDNEYFSDGLSEELLNVLAKTPGLKVTGRTSSFAFKGKHEDLREIGQKLGVSTLLEGSVRRAGNRVRITAQLVKAADGFHMWSETYDRVLDDIFAVQDEIARAVAAALNLTLLGTAPAPVKTNGEAYDRVLRADQCNELQTESSLGRAVTLYGEALAISPDDARAWAGLARAHMGQAVQGFADSLDGYRKAREALDKALALDPRLPEAYETLGWVLAAFEFRWTEAGEAFTKALGLAPGNGRILASMAIFLGFCGRTEESLRASAEAVANDPLSAQTHLLRARVLLWAFRDDESLMEFAKALELSPGITTAHASRAYLHLHSGRVAEAVAEARKEVSAGYRHWALAAALHDAGDARGSDESLAALTALGPEWAYQVACVYGYRGEVNRAFEWLERAHFQRDPGVPLVKVTRALRKLHGDPRWPRFLERLGLPA